MNYTNRDHLRKLIELQLRSRKTFELNRSKGDIIV